MYLTCCCEDGGGGAVTPHELLSVTHSDTLTAAVSRGSLIVGNATPLWSELVIGTANSLLKSDGTDATWVVATGTGAPVLATSPTLVTPTITTSLTVPHIYGGAAANDDLTLEGTSHATKTTSYVILQPTAGRVGIGTTTPLGNLDVRQNPDGTTMFYGQRATNTLGGTGFLIQFTDATPTNDVFTVDTKGNIVSRGTLDITNPDGTTNEVIEAGNNTTVNNMFPVYRFRNYYTTGGSGSMFLIAGIFDNGGARSTALDVAPTINHTGGAGFSILRISPYLQAVGSGTKLLLDIGTNTAAEGGGTHTSLLTFSSVGDLTISGIMFAGGYKSSDGSAGVTAGPFTTITSITVKDGLVTALTGA